jgi:hypothetical protein
LYAVPPDRRRAAVSCRGRFEWFPLWSLVHSILHIVGLDLSKGLLLRVPHPVRLPSLRSGALRAGSFAFVRKGGRHRPQTLRFIGPWFPPLQTTQGWGTLFRGDFRRERKGGPPVRFQQKPRTKPTASAIEKMNQRLQRIWKLATSLTAIVGLVGWLWSSQIWFDYQRTLPRSPNVAAGRIYPLNVHGIVVYQTNAERLRLDKTQYASVAVFGLSALLAVLYRRRFGPPPPGPPKEFNPG